MRGIKLKKMPEGLKRAIQATNPHVEGLEPALREKRNVIKSRLSIMRNEDGAVLIVSAISAREAAVFIAHQSIHPAVGFMTHRAAGGILNDLIDQGYWRANLIGAKDSLTLFRKSLAKAIGAAVRIADGILHIEIKDPNAVGNDAPLSELLPSRGPTETSRKNRKMSFGD
jgi:hypothetical protein